jgi:hypothetical protein
MLFTRIGEAFRTSRDWLNHMRTAVESNDAPTVASTPVFRIEPRWAIRETSVRRFATAVDGVPTRLATRAIEIVCTRSTLDRSVRLIVSCVVHGRFSPGVRFVRRRFHSPTCGEANGKRCEQEYESDIHEALRGAFTRSNVEACEPLCRAFHGGRPPLVGNGARANKGIEIAICHTWPAPSLDFLSQADVECRGTVGISVVDDGTCATVAVEVDVHVPARQLERSAFVDRIAQYSFPGRVARFRAARASCLRAGLTALDITRAFVPGILGRTFAATSASRAGQLQPRFRSLARALVTPVSDRASRADGAFRRPRAGVVTTRCVTARLLTRRGIHTAI